jgi:phosphohistidine phosphatase
MQIYLLRHGQATSEQVDARRPLSQDGEQEVSLIANFLIKNNNIQEILHSSKLRAQQTAEIIHKIACPKAHIREYAGLLPNDAPEEVLVYLDALSNDTLLVSHLPYLGNLCSLLTTNDLSLLEVKITTATLVCLEKQREKWGIVWIVNPNLLIP